MAKKTQSEVVEAPAAERFRSEIFIKGARANNLQNIDLHIPKNKLVVVTGVSGSGKSSITMDTLYAEGQRRYVCLLYTSPSPRDATLSRMPSSA